MWTSLARGPIVMCDDEGAWTRVGSFAPHGSPHQQFDKPNRPHGPSSDQSLLCVQDSDLPHDHPGGDLLQPVGDRQCVSLQEVEGHQQLLPGQPRLCRSLRRLLCHDLQRVPADFWKVARVATTPNEIFCNQRQFSDFFGVKKEHFKKVTDI